MGIFDENRIYILILAIALHACAHSEPFVWVEQVPNAPAPKIGHIIQPGDELMVSVWAQEQISGVTRVRDDGHISMILVGDIAVAGQTIAQAAKIIANRIEGKIVQDAKVTVILQSSRSNFVSVIGEVREPGQFVLGPNDNLLDVLSKAGGLTEFAKKDGIYLLRKGSQTPRIRFDYDRLTTKPSGGLNFELRDGDVVVVE